MKTERNILVAFLLNLGFSLFEFIGGIVTNSVAITSDAVHDMGDALSIGVSYFLERISKKNPDDHYTYGYIRYSVIGSMITTIILLLGSIFVIYHSVERFFHPVAIHYNGMIILAVVGVMVNFLAAYFTRDGDSLNQRSVNLHMLEDVLGWVVVLLGAIIMRFTDITVIDSVLSILVALFILVSAFGNFKMITYLFLEKIPANISIMEIKEHLMKIKGIEEVHHPHLFDML